MLRNKTKRIWNRTKSLAYLNKLLIKYYNSGKNARQEGRTVAYVSVGFPVELLYAIDVLPCFPQNHAAFYGTQGKTADVFGPAEGVGMYSTDLCSEIKATIGMALAGESLSFSLPKPDLIISANNICGSITKCAEALSRYYQVPLFLIDTPFVSSTVNSYSIDYVKSQFKDLISFLEKVTGRKYDYDKLAEVCDLSWQTLNLWKEIVDLSKNIPAPQNGLDSFTHILPLTTLRGTEDAVNYYQRLKSEIQKRVEQKVSAIPEERYRLFWDFLPIYHKMKYLSKLFTRYNACFVAASFFFPVLRDENLDEGIDPGHVDSKNMTPDQILHYLSLAYLTLYVNRTVDYKASLFTKLGQDFSIDGFVFHVDRSCKPQSLPQYELRNFMEEAGFSTLIIDADSMDPRYFSEAQVTTRIEAFMEALENNTERPKRKQKIQTT